MKALRAVECFVVVLLLGSVGLSLRRATPLRLHEDFERRQRVHPTSVDQAFDQIFRLPLDAGGGAVVSLQHGCLATRLAERGIAGPQCNPDLFCHSSPFEPNRFEVYQLGRDEFYIATGSVCDSHCCDWRGMLVSGTGRRLDDGPIDRTYQRLGMLGKVGLLTAAGAIVWQLTQRRIATGARVAIVLGLLSTIVSLCMSH